MSSFSVFPAVDVFQLCNNQPRLFYHTAAYISNYSMQIAEGCIFFANDGFTPVHFVHCFEHCIITSMYVRITCNTVEATVGLQIYAKVSNQHIVFSTVVC